MKRTAPAIGANQRAPKQPRGPPPAYIMYGTGDPAAAKASTPTSSSAPTTAAAAPPWAGGGRTPTRDYRETEKARTLDKSTNANATQENEGENAEAMGKTA